jgi:hypothetical protein
MRNSIALIFLVMLTRPALALGQQPVPQPKDEPSSIVVIDTPPPPPQSTQPQAPSEGVVLQRPGTVLLSGTPVRTKFRSPTDGVSFLLQSGGSYTSISGVSVGMGWGGWGGWGWGGYGWGYGMAPYYGEMVTRAYQPICSAPCDATLLSGSHRFALSLNEGRPVNVPQPIDLSVDSVVEGRYVDKSRMRKAGWATFVAGAITGMALMFASIDYHSDPYYGDQIRYRPMMFTGVGLFVGSIIAGSVLAAQDDEAQVTVYPED